MGNPPAAASSFRARDWDALKPSGRIRPMEAAVWRPPLCVRLSLTLCERIAQHTSMQNLGAMRNAFTTGWGSGPSPRRPSVVFCGKDNLIIDDEKTYLIIYYLLKGAKHGTRQFFN